MMNMDIFGLALRYFYVDKCKVELLVERDDGYSSLDDVSKYFSTYEYWRRCERLAIQHAKGRVLDIGCGAGRHSLYLISKGFEVYSIDISPCALEVALRRGVPNPVLMDMNRLGFRDGIFNTIVLLGGGLGLAGKLDDIKKFLSYVRKLLCSNGVLIGSSADPFKTLDARHIRYHERNRRRGIYPGTVKIRLAMNSLRSPWFYYTLLDPKTLQKICNETGWKIIKKYEDDYYYAVVLAKAH